MFLDWWYNQFFAADEPGGKPEVIIEDDDDDDGEEEILEVEENVTSEKTLSQADLDRVIDKTYAKWMRRQQNELKEKFGVTDLNHIAEAYKAGVAVSQAAGLKPNEVIQKLHPSEFTPPVNDPILQELQAMKGFLVNQQQEQILEQQRATTRKEFGKLFDEYQIEIEDLAEEKNLALVDAAALVLRPHLPEWYKNRAKAQTQNKRKRIDGSDGAPAGSDDDGVSKLTKAQANVARKMGVSLKEYAKQLKSLGELD